MHIQRGSQTPGFSCSLDLTLSIFSEIIRFESDDSSHARTDSIKRTVPPVICIALILTAQLKEWKGLVH